MKNWIEQLQPIINEYGEGEALDGDAVDDLCAIIRAKINLSQGNITEEEYEEALDDKDIYAHSPDNRRGVTNISQALDTYMRIDSIVEENYPQVSEEAWSQLENEEAEDE
jgi:hypothetical protein